MKASIYTPAFKEQALVKLYSRGSRTVRAVAEEINLNYFTAKGWMREKEKQNRNQGLPAKVSEKRPQDWTRAEQLSALQATYGLTEAEIGAWCRSNGLFPHHLATWQTEFCKTPVTALSTAAESRKLKDLQADINRLQRDVSRKDKALAEAAALLMLQKKFSALWEGEDK